MASAARRRIMIVEDEYMLAEALDELFTGQGYAVVGPTGTLWESLALLDVVEKPDVALLDVNLGGEPVFPVADRLIELGVPYVFITGYDSGSIPERYRDATHCRKPFSTASLTSAVAKVLQAAD
jgi:CheY-like chemotaxis protein